MLDGLQLFPPYLICMTVVLVIIPTIATIFIRRSLYKYLQDLAKKVSILVTQLQEKEAGLKKYEEKERKEQLREFKEDLRRHQPSLISKLEDRFEVASRKLEKVNTTALIDELYSQEKFRFLGFSLACEQWDYFCQVLPNLLLAFGLLGTFLGITINLYTLSQTTSQFEASNVSNLLTQIQTPLQSMGIAFITSLIALVCSSFLTIINVRCNTNLAKYLLISSLEDYLDHIFHTIIDGYSRLDQVVNRMTQSQEEFLTRFHDNVKKVLETTFGDAVDKIVEENKKANNVAIQVYQRLLESSGTFARGVDTFKTSALLIDKQVEKMTNLVSSFEKSSQTIHNSSQRFGTASIKIEKSKFSENLENLTVDLATTQRSFSEATSVLSGEIKAITESNKQAAKSANLVYQGMQESSVKLKDSAQVFTEASEKIAQSQFADKLSSASADLANSHNQFAQSTLKLSESTQLIESSLNKVQESIQQIITTSEGINSLNQQSGKIIDLTEKRLANEEAGLNNVSRKIIKLLEDINSMNQQSGQVLNLTEKRLAKEEAGLNNISGQLSKLINKIVTTSEKINKLNQQSGEIINLTEKRLAKEEAGLNKINSNLAQLVVTEKQQEKQFYHQLQQLLTGFGQYLASQSNDLGKLISILTENQAQNSNGLQRQQRNNHKTNNTQRRS